MPGTALQARIERDSVGNYDRNFRQIVQVPG